MTPEQATRNIRQRLSLRAPQAESLDILHQLTTEHKILDDSVPLEDRLAGITARYAKVTDFEREFPSLCFALATGVGKTRLMGAFIAYLHLAHGLSNFFVLAPNLTIYNKLIGDFDPIHPKYVFRGLSEFTAYPPEIITGDDYAQKGQDWIGLQAKARINIFNISKINTEVRGGKSPRIKRLSEYLGQSYFEYLSKLPDLVLIMDESHRYRGSAGVQAINELAPRLGLELTATPFQVAGKDQRWFKNVIYDYPLRRAMDDGFVKVPAVVTRRNFDPSKPSAAELERIKLEDGVRLHEHTRVALATYAQNNGRPLVKPFMLVIARDTEHATNLLAHIESREFFDGRYAGRVIQVDSSKISDDGVVERLLSVEKADSEVEIVIHVNMLKEGWDVTNLYTIVPLRAATARTLIEQTIGRGLRLPYGQRTGDALVDRLSIVAHDRFQEIVDEANREDSPIQRLEQVEIDPDNDSGPSVVISPVSSLDKLLGVSVPSPTPSIGPAPIPQPAPIFVTPHELTVARAAVEVLHKVAAVAPEELTRPMDVAKPELMERVIKEVATQLYGPQLPLSDEATELHPELDVIVTKMAEEMEKRTIQIPRISVFPKEGTRSGYRSFPVDVSQLRFQPNEEALTQTQLTDGATTEIGIEIEADPERSSEALIVERLALFDDVDYEPNAEVLYDLAGQVVRHFESYLSVKDADRVVRQFVNEIAARIHAQMQPHFWENDTEYEWRVGASFVPLKAQTFSHLAGQPLLNPLQPVPDKREIASYVYTGFARCLFEHAKFRSDQERILASVLDKEVVKWFQPAAGQFLINYRFNGIDREYVPDFVAETKTMIYMIEVKRQREIDSGEVVAKSAAARTWCRRASEAAQKHQLLPWQYAILPHDAIKANMTFEYLTKLSVQE